MKELCGVGINLKRADSSQVSNGGEGVCAGQRTGGGACVLPPEMKTTVPAATTQQRTTL